MLKRRKLLEEYGRKDRFRQQKESVFHFHWVAFAIDKFIKALINKCDAACERGEDVSDCLDEAVNTDGEEVCALFR